MSATKTVSSSGAPAISVARRPERVAAPAPTGRRSIPPSTVGPTRWARNSKLVTAAEVAAAAAQRPEQVGVLVRGGAHDPPVGEHDLGGQQRVDRQAVPAHQPADAAAEREPADAGVGDLPGRNGEPVRLRGGVELAEQRAAADAHDRRAPGRPRRR